MTKAVICGTFDPITLGHMDIITRSCQLFDHVTVFVAPNSTKHTLYSLEQRYDWLKRACQDLPHVDCRIQEGLAVEACKKAGAQILVRGIRNGLDCDYEQNMAYMNRCMDAQIETVCLFTRLEFQYCSSSNVRELIKYHQDASAFVPACVWEDIKKGNAYENID